jgi:hypothetical protein
VRDGSRARWAEYGLLALLALLGSLPLIAMLRHAAAADLVFGGADGPFAADQFQYMAWIREYGNHLLAANTLDVAPSDNVFFHPMFFVSGLGVRAGLSVELTFLLWKPVAIVLLFLGFRAYVRRFVDGAWARVAALAIALFCASPMWPLVEWEPIESGDRFADVNVAAGEAFATGLLWGYLPAVISVALIPVFLLGIERVASSERPSPLDLAWVSAVGALASWLHPWQGEVLVLVVVGAVALERFPRRRWILAIPVGATAAPLFYYFALSRIDADWELAQQANALQGQVSLWAALLALLPLLAAAALGVRTLSHSLADRMLLLIVPAALLVLVALSPSFPQHALEGISLPLAILAVRGLATVPRRTAATAALAAVLILPGVAWSLDFMRDTVRAGAQPHYLEQGERDALSYLDAEGAPGAVLTDGYLGSLVPAKTGRTTWVGHPSWTRDYEERARQAGELFDGKLPRADAERLVRGSQATHVLVDCANARTAPRALGPLVADRRQFGCASVYRVAAR